MDEEIDLPPMKPSPLDAELDDRLAALESRNAAHDRLQAQSAGRGQIALVLALAGVGLAVATALHGSPLFALCSLAAALVVLGLGSRVLATVNGVAAVAGLLIAVVVVPALHEIDQRTQQAVDNLILTATASQPMMDTGPDLGGFDGPLAFPTFGPIDVDIDGGGAVLPES